MKQLSCNGCEILVLAGRSPSLDQLKVLEELQGLIKNLKILVLENKNCPMDDFLSVLPMCLRDHTYFVYLPKRNPADCLLNPQEVVERMQFRTSQCESCNERFQLASFGAGMLADPLIRKFYEEPSLELFLKISQKKNHLRYFLLTLIRSTGLAGILGFIFWFLKILLNPSGYNILQDLRGWGFRFFGWLRGSVIDLKGALVSSAVKTYWWCRGLMGRSWQLRVVTQSLIGQRWRLKVYLQKLFSERWRLKVFLQNLYSQRWKAKVYVMGLLSNRWKLKVYLLRSFAHTWKIRVFVQGVWGQFWRVRVGLIRLKWYIVSLFWRFKGLLIFIRFHVVHSVFMPVWKIVSFPFRKVYWFIEYQYKKRIIKSFEVDDGK
ncbi:MAG: hypothetical protein HUU57_04720 [Bdellovibrio sp.]|nr:hypothetical protein [Bdellovibrio sp.]